MPELHGRLSRRDRDLVSLTVLALLAAGPRHPYEMHRFVVDTRKDFVTGLPRSLYHAVDRLEADGLVAVDSTERIEGRPERTRYALTDAGRADVRSRIALLLSVPDADATLVYAALSYIGLLGPHEALLALRARTAALDLRRGQLAEDLKSAAGLPRALLIEAEFEQARLAAERDWFARIADDIGSGDLSLDLGIPS